MTVLVDIDPIDPAAASMWRTIAKLGDRLGTTDPWCLVGGQMVALFLLEAGQIQRPTNDIDILGDARARPSMTERITTTLDDLGARLLAPAESGEDHGFRFQLDGEKEWHRISGSPKRPARSDPGANV